MAAPVHNNNTDGLDAFLLRMRLDADARDGDAEEAAERAWLAHVNRGHEFSVRGAASYPPIAPHPTDNGKPMRDTRLWPARGGKS